MARLIMRRERPLDNRLCARPLLVLQGGTSVARQFLLQFRIFLSDRFFFLIIILSCHHVRMLMELLLLRSALTIRVFQFKPFAVLFLLGSLVHCFDWSV